MDQFYIFSFNFFKIILLDILLEDIYIFVRLFKYIFRLLEIIQNIYLFRLLEIIQIYIYLDYQRSSKYIFI